MWLPVYNMEEQHLRQTTFSHYTIRRIGKVILMFALLAAVRPAMALFSPSSNVDTIQSVTIAAMPSSVPVGLASVATAGGLDEAMPNIQDFPDVRLTAALVKELGAKQPLFVYHPSARWPLASVSKLMTAVVALDTFGPATILTVSQEAVDTEGLAGGLKAGEKYSVIDLVRAMLTVSSNDAAIVLARAYDKKQLGTEVFDAALNKTALFTAAMQQKAHDLGMFETYYGDPSGLSVVNQSIITDLELLTNYIVVNHPEIFEITRRKENVILERRSNTRRTIVSINEFAGQPDFLGGKTGRTDEAGGNLLSLFRYSGKEYLIIVFGTEGTEDRFSDTIKLYDWIKKSQAKL